MADFKQSLEQLNRQINSFFSFIGRKLKNFKSLSTGEQIAFLLVGLGLLLVLVSIVLFIL